METGILSIYIGGALSFLMAIFHIQFPKIFKWKIDLRKASELNRKVLFTIHLALLLLFMGIALVSFSYASELGSSMGLAFGVNLMLALFWLWRTIWQVVYFKPDKTSKLKNMHYILILLFFLLFLAYSFPMVLRYF